jgi:hypothetical protein
MKNLSNGTFTITSEFTSFSVYNVRMSTKK